MGAQRSSPNFGNQGGTFSRDKDECIEGHRFDLKNTRWRVRKDKQGRVTGKMRVCIACAKRRSRLHRIEKIIIDYSEELGNLRRE